MKKTLLAAGAVLALSSSFTVNAAENDKPQYLSDWWHQSVNVVGSYHTRFGPQIRNDTYLEYEAFAKKDWFDFYGYADAPVFFTPFLPHWRRAHAISCCISGGALPRSGRQRT